MFSRNVKFVWVVLAMVFSGIEPCFRTSEHEHISITTGISFYKECQCTEPGYTINNMRWVTNGLPIQPLGPGKSKNVYTEEQEDSINLHIPSVTKDLSGVYQCETHVDGITYTQSYSISAYDPIYFYDTPVDQYLVDGQTSAIVCQPRSDTTVITTWQKENVDEVYDISDDEKYYKEPDRLIINNVTKNDAGMYKCAARAILTNEEVDKYISVQVLTVPVITGIKATPEVYQPTTVVAGMNLTIECIADGTPHPEYHWNKTSDVANDESSRVSYRQELNTIIFEDIRPEDRGTYTCFAHNLAGVATMDTFVEVLVPPQILVFPNITEVEGATVELFCNATGKPEPTILITYEGKDLESNYTDTEPSPNRAVMMLDRSKEGIYVCEATNEVGTVDMAMFLTVLHRPYFELSEESLWGWEGKTVNLNCEHDSNPAAEIVWRFHGDNNINTPQELEINRQLLEALNRMPEPYFSLTIDNETAYGTYECVAKNSYGEATKRITLVEGFRPGLVRDVIFTDLTATSVTFDIQGPSYEYVTGPAVIGFTATYDEASNFETTDIHINRTWAVDRPFRLDRLKSNTTYYVRFAAVNEVGTGNWSEYYEFTTLDKSVPEPPEWYEDPIILAQRSHVLKWRAPDDNGDPIDQYILRYCSEEDDEELCKTKEIKAPATELELEDLAFNTTYFLELTAHNSRGDSVPANITVLVPAPSLVSPTTLLSGGAIIGISIVIVVLCLLLLDVLLLVWRRQGIIATCCIKKEKIRKETTLNSRDKKGLLTNGESEDRPGSLNGHKEFQYNKSTGVVTGKHSEV